MKKYTTPELREMALEMESVLCASGLAGELGAGFEDWNEEKMPWDE